MLTCKYGIEVDKKLTLIFLIKFFIFTLYYNQCYYNAISEGKCSYLRKTAFNKKTLIIFSLNWLLLMKC